MVSHIHTASILGINAVPTTVESYIHTGLPLTVIVGMPDIGVRESKERVKAAIRAEGYTYPVARISVNLSPADVPKYGTQYDMAIAIAILHSSNQVRFSTQNKLFVGELSLDGKVRSIKGALAIALMAQGDGINELYLPASSLEDVRSVSIAKTKVYGVSSLKQLVTHLCGTARLKPEPPRSNRYIPTPHPERLLNIAGQSQAKRALEIACTGNHNILSPWAQFGRMHSLSLKPSFTSENSAIASADRP